jgi:cystathionine beta-lyase family protein involved in aluminum resistance
MKQTNLVLTITLIVVIFMFLIRIEKSFNKMTYVKSSVNDTTYMVRKLDDKDQAADMLAETHNTLKQVCKILENSHPDDERVKRLIAKFPYTTIQESDGYGSQTSFSINKGEKIVLCLRSKDGTNKFVDKNVLLFVALHEISHIMTVSIDHTPEFWDNFKFVLKECQGKGIYKCIDFSSKPQSYCGITVTSSPFPCNN